MSFDSMLLHTLVVKRNAVTLDGNGDPIRDEWGNPITAPVLVSMPLCPKHKTNDHIHGLIQPRSAREIALTSQAGAVIGTHCGYMRPLPGLTTADWIEHDGVRFDILSMPDAGGVGHHLELALQAVT